MKLLDDAPSSAPSPSSQQSLNQASSSSSSSTTTTTLSSTATKSSSTAVVVVSPLVVAAVLVCASVAAGLGAYFAVLASRRGDERYRASFLNQQQQQKQQQQQRQQQQQPQIHEKAKHSIRQEEPRESGDNSSGAGKSTADAGAEQRWKVLAKEAAVCFKGGDFAAAQALYEDATRVCEAAGLFSGRAMAVLRTNLGLCQQQLDNHDGAVETFSAILESLPGMPQALKHRARSRKQLGQLDGALVDLLVQAVIEGQDQNSPAIQELYTAIVERRLRELQVEQERQQEQHDAENSGLARNDSSLSSPGGNVAGSCMVQGYLWRFYRSCFASDVNGEVLNTSELQIVEATINSSGSGHSKAHALTQQGYHFKKLGQDEVRVVVPRAPWPMRASSFERVLLVVRLFVFLA